MSNTSVHETKEHLKRTLNVVQPEMKLLYRRFDSLGLIRQLSRISHSADQALAAFTKARLAAGHPPDEVAEAADLEVAHVELVANGGYLRRGRIQRCGLISPSFVAMPPRNREALADLNDSAVQDLENGVFDIGQLPKNLARASIHLASFADRIESCYRHAVYTARVDHKTWAEIADESRLDPFQVASHYAELCYQQAAFDYDEFCLSEHPKAIKIRRFTLDRLDLRQTSSPFQSEQGPIEAEVADLHKGLPVEERVAVERHRLISRAREDGRLGYQYPETYLDAERWDSIPVLSQPKLNRGVSAPISFQTRPDENRALGS